MKNVCSNCGNSIGIIRKTDEKIGLFCAKCGKWLQWFNKEDLKLLAQIKKNKIQKQNNSNNEQIHNKTIDRCIEEIKSKNKAEWKESEIVQTLEAVKQKRKNRYIDR